jgi:hypothetical protein
MKSTFVATSLAAVVLASAGESAAYCRTRTCEFEPDASVRCQYDPVSGCSTVGKEAYWGKTCLPYAIQKDGSAQGISAEQLRRAVVDGFALWTSVPCAGGGSPAFSAFDRGNIACGEIEYNCDAGDQNNNIIVFKDGLSDLESEQLALSILTANLDTGEIFDVDVEINSRDWNFGGNMPEADLVQVINHELGHFLGLSHTRASNALMRATYGVTSVPEDDDMAGICAIYENSTANPACNVSRLTADAACVGTLGTCRITVEGTDGGGCACDVAGRPSQAGAWSAAALLALAGGLYRRRAGRPALEGAA